MVKGDKDSRSGVLRRSIQFDRYQRLEALARQVRGLPDSVPGFVLDVGGRPGELAKFLPDYKVIVVDLPAAGKALCQEVHADACSLPFGDASCEVVVSCDVMEHLAPDCRSQFVNELFRVTHGWVVLGMPRGAPDVYAAERAVDTFHRLLHGVRHPWLAEHFRNGVPTRAEIEANLSSLGAEYVRIPNGYLRRWVLGMVVNRYLESLEFAELRLERFNAMYNAIYTDDDTCSPAYRDIYVATNRSRQLPEPATQEKVVTDIGWDPFWQMFSVSQEYADLVQTTSPSITVIVVAYNHESFLECCLSALRASVDVDMEIVVVDNGSQDESASVACRCGAMVVRAGENLGFAGGFNLGWRVGRGELLVSVNPDVVVDPWALSELRQGCLEQKTTAVVGGKLLNWNGTTIQHAGGVIRENFCTEHIGRGAPADEWQQPASVEYVTGALMAVKRKALEEVGGLDERFWPAYYEETDLCVRVKRAGYDVLYWPWASGRHGEASTLGGESEQFFRAYHRGRLRFAGQHLLPRNAVRFMRAERRFRRDRSPADTEMKGLRRAWKGWWWRLPFTIAVSFVRRMVSRTWQE
jgi:GT2 family glycosyltransferase